MERSVVINIPIAVQLILDKLQSNGYEAYIVGGCVRDSIMGRTPHDWDICTSALPEQIIEVFKDYTTIPTGIKHGTVTVVLKDGIISKFYEITTYRIDGEYKDSRHPESVEFVSDLKQDLSRRDFTINAMAYNPKEGLIDYFGGVNDIDNKVIRCVGLPKKRFKEDALRIMRALRFAMKFDFEIEGQTNYAMDIFRDNLKNISVERINSEISKMLTCRVSSNKDKERFLRQRWLYLYMLKYLHVVNPKITEVGYAEKFFIIDKYNYEDLCFDLAVTFDGNDVEDTLRWLKYSNEIIDKVKEICWLGHCLVKYSKEWEHDYSNYPARKLLNIIQHNDYEVIIDFAKSLCKNGEQFPGIPLSIKLDSLESRIDECRRNYDPYLLKHLKIDGNDLKALGYQGREIGKILNGLLDLVMRDKVKNNHDDLIIAIPQVMTDG